MHISLHGMTAYRQWIVYKLVPSSSRPGKTDKLPYDLNTGRVVSAHNSEHWMSAEDAETTAALLGDDYGVGFVFTAADPFWFLDIDNCLVNGEWSPLAIALCILFAGCAIEVSRSGTGLHIFGSGVPPAHRSRGAGIEFYSSGRFAAITGANAIGDCRADATAVLPAFVAQYLPADTAVSAGAGVDGPVAEWRGPVEDAELVRRAMRSGSAASAFGGKASFTDLWTGNLEALARSYPDAGGREYDQSAADAALAQHLAWWTGNDAGRMERMMRQSALVRDKWDSHTSYMDRTIQGAVGRQEKVYAEPGSAAAVAVAPVTVVTVDGVGAVESPAPRGGNGYMDRAAALEHFKGCVYIESSNRVLTPDGSIIKPDAFAVRYGGFTFRLDEVNDKTTEDAWKAWTQNKMHTVVRAFSTCFRPELPLGAIVTRNGLRLANTYIPLHIERAAGDVSPFLTHLHKLLPVERDAAIFLSYMAALVQHQGYKFQWAPLLQGVEGNGKSFFSYAVEGAVGARYTHWPKAKKLAKDFNSWMTGKVFYAVEDIYVPDGKREVMEDLKPMITGRSMEIEQKGVDQVTADICGNFIFNTNHKDGIIKTDRDRRFCMLFTAQQSVEDLERDGMHSAYMTRLYKWLRAEGGGAAVNDFLLTYAIPAEFNPAGDCQRAPYTSSHDEALQASKGNIEQEIEEAIEQGRQGFQGGWISSVMLDRYLDDLGMATRISRARRKQILENMGYVWHPALIKGRVNNPVIPENSKTSLYIHRSNTMLAQIPNANAVAKAYEGANRAMSGLPFPIAR